jgi:hypothetical protein
MLTRMGGPSGLVVAALPTAVFVAACALTSVNPALLVTAITAALIFGWRTVRREPLRQAAVGLLVAAACIASTLVTGQARDFFLVPVLIPVVAIVACLGSVAVRRPLAGILLNRMVGGPARWPAQRRLARVYTVSTLVFAGVNVLNFSIQVALYRADRTGWLAVAHVLSPVLFGGVMVVTVVLARRAR